MAGSPITYTRGMELDEEQQELWNSYTEENREKFFWLFLNTFVDNWEKQVGAVLKLPRSCLPLGHPTLPSLRSFKTALL